MSNFLPLFFVTVAIFTFFVAALGIKMFFDKKAEFKGGCASNNPLLTNEIGECGVCGRVPTGNCDATEGEELPEIG